MVIVYLYPIVILDINLSGVILTNPERFDAPREGQHQFIIIVSRVDMPFAMGGKVIKHNTLTCRTGLFEIPVKVRGRTRFVSG
jgi:hypothetical protein